MNGSGEKDGNIAEWNLSGSDGWFPKHLQIGKPA